MEKFKKKVLYLGKLLLPTVMLIIMMALIMFCFGAIFSGVIHNDENVVHEIQELSE